MKTFAPGADAALPDRPSESEAEAAVRTLLRWAGDDPDREGLRDTPGRVVRAYREWFRGYEEDPEDMLARTFEEVEGYDEMVMLRDIRFESFASIIWRRSSGGPMSAISPPTGWSVSPSWRGWSMPMPSGCRCRRR